MKEDAGCILLVYVNEILTKNICIHMQHQYAHTIKMSLQAPINRTLK